MDKTYRLLRSLSHRNRIYIIKLDTVIIWFVMKDHGPVFSESDTCQTAHRQKHHQNRVSIIILWASCHFNDCLLFDIVHVIWIIAIFISIFSVRTNYSWARRSRMSVIHRGASQYTMGCRFTYPHDLWYTPKRALAPGPNTPFQSPPLPWKTGVSVMTLLHMTFDLHIETGV